MVPTPMASTPSPRAASLTKWRPPPSMSQTPVFPRVPWCWIRSSTLTPAGAPTLIGIFTTRTAMCWRSRIWGAANTVCAPTCITITRPTATPAPGQTASRRSPALTLGQRFLWIPVRRPEGQQAPAQRAEPSPVPEKGRLGRTSPHRTSRHLSRRTPARATKPRRRE